MLIESDTLACHPSESLNLDQLRARLRRMSDEQLEKWGRAAKFMCESGPDGRPPREVYVVQLEEARAEWKRRKAQAR